MFTPGKDVVLQYGVILEHLAKILMSVVTPQHVVRICRSNVLRIEIANITELDKI